MMAKLFWTILFAATVIVGLVFVNGIPNGMGQNTTTSSTGIAARQLWATQLQAPVVSPLIIADGLIYEVTSWSGGPANNLCCFNASTGKQVWAFSADNPVLDGGILYAGSIDNNFYALNASTGEQIWNLTGIGWVTNAVISGDIIYFGNNNYSLSTETYVGFMYAFNALTGVKIWNYSETGTNFINGQVLVNGNTVYATSSVFNSKDNSWLSAIYAFNASDGTKIWNSSTASYFGSEALDQGKIYVSYELTTSVSDEYTDGVLALDALTGAKIWDHPNPDPFGSPAFANNMIYLISTSGSVYSLRDSTGELVWNYSSGAKAYSWSGLGGPASPLVVNNRLFFTTYSGVYCLDALKGTEIWKYVNATGDFSYNPGAEGGPPATPPTYANGSIYVGSGGPGTFNSWLEHNVYALDASSGAKIWNYTIENVINNPPIVIDDIVYVAADAVTHYSGDFPGNGSIYSFKLETVVVPQPTPSPPPATPPSGSLVVPDNYQTIQDAISHANNGDTVFVRRGIYYAEGYEGITIDKQISLIGEDPSDTFIFTQWYRYANTVIQVTADNVTISGFTISGGGSLEGIDVEDSYAHVPSRCNITGNNIVGNSDGIITRGDNNDVTGVVKPLFDVISNNNVSQNSGYGIYVSSSNTTVTGNSVTANTDGIIVDSCVNVTIAGNYIADNHPSDPTSNYDGEGLYLRWWGPFYVYGNNITGNAGAGLAFGEYCNNSTIYDNNIASNGLGIQLNNVTQDLVGKGNRLYGNNLNNNQQVLVGSITDLCLWDNGKEGNYWSDYSTRYPNATEIGSTGTGNTPCVIDANNVDHHPLMKSIVLSSNLPAKATPSPSVPEFPTWIITPLLMSTILLVAVSLKRRTKPQ